MPMDPRLLRPKARAALDPFASFVSMLLHLDSDFSDSSASGFVATPHNDAAISGTESKFGGGSLALDADDWLSLPVDASLDLSQGDFTAEAWIYAVDSSPFQSALAEWQGNDIVFIVGISGGEVICYWGTDGSVPAFTGGAVLSETWHHLALVRSGSDLTAYVDGAVAGSVTITDPPYSGIPLTIGAYNDGGDGAGPWGGFLDEIRITKQARYTAPFSAPDAPFPDP